MKRTILFTLLCFMVASATLSCSSQKRKKKCNTCPVWKDMLELPQ
jgi:hypothetical protein